MPTFAGIQKFFGRTVSEGAAFAAGVAVAPALEPVVREVVNEAWSKYQTMPLSPGDWAEIVGEDVEQQSVGETEAKKHGVKPADFDALVQAVLNAPGLPDLLLLRRRGLISDATFLHGLRKARLEPRWDDVLRALVNVPLPPAVAALAAVRGLIDAEGTLPVNPPTEEGRIQAFPVYPISGKQAAAAAGYSEDEYGVMVGINGRPMSLHEAASAYFRQIIELADYYRAVSEGDTRNEWRDAILEQARQITTAHDAIENAIRGYSDQPTMLARTARHGMSEEDSMILFQNAGRPLVAHQITTGLARGGQFNPEPGEQTDPYDAAVRESNVKPSYYDLWKANRYNYPSLFQLNNLVKGGAISADTATDWAQKDGFAPEVLEAMHAYWATQESSASGSGAGGAAAKPKPYTYSQIHAAWRHSVFTDAAALAELEAIGYSAAKAETLLNTWKATAASDV